MRRAVMEVTLALPRAVACPVRPAADHYALAVDFLDVGRPRVALVALAAVACSPVSPGGVVRAPARRPSPRTWHGLRQEVAALRGEARDALRHLAVVRYDAFGDMGGHLSWSLALLDDAGNGVALTSIHGRREARTYAKNVTGWTSERQFSPEEQDAVASAKP